MKPVAVGVSGRIGSGKTTFARALSERLGCPHASFGGHVRNVAAGRGLDIGNRQILQDLGDELIAAGWPEFCSAVLSDANYSTGSVVVDGVRHVAAARALEHILSPVPWRLVAVSVAADVREERLLERGASAAAARKAEAHPNEAEVGTVIDIANITVPETLSVERAVGDVYRQLAADIGA
jgi:adenylate kinase family enzyme